jgi:hypothetical protein
LFTARNARVEATTIAADEETPEPTGTVPLETANPLAPGDYKKLQGRRFY